jgi:hypothetical protein
MPGASVTGDWKRARRSLEGGGAKLTRAIERAVLHEAQALRKAIVLQIRDQEGFKPLSPWTIAKRKLVNRGGTKALIQRGDLVGSIGVVKAGSDEVFVGIPRSAKNAGAGGKSGDELIRVGAVHEYGTDPIIIQITPKMRRYLAAVASKLPGNKQYSDGKGSDVIVMQIPARPFLRPAFDRWRGGVHRRLYQRIAQNMGWT